MTEVLLFRLFGPLASWGEVAVGEVRPSASRPTRSAILGLMAAALGIDREEDERHNALSKAFRFALRVDLPGTAMVDYQTIHWRKPRRKEVFLTRADELRGPTAELQTIQSTRHYRCDALVTVAAMVANDAPEPRDTWLSRARDAIDRPHYVLSLGRKACAPSLPMAPQILRAESVVLAFARYDALLAGIEGGLPAQLARQSALRPAVDLAWDEDLPLPLGVEATIARREHRRDQPSSRRRWRFQERCEHIASIETTIFGKEGNDVSEPAVPS